MLLPSTLQGRPFGAVQLAEIKQLLEQSPQSSRYQLSRRLATLWNWRTASGQLKDMAARTLLLKLQEQGWIKLPERRWESPTRSGRAPAETPLALLDETRFEGSLSSLLPLRIEELSQLGRHVRRAQLEACVARYHYLGYRSRVGQNLQYWISSAQERPLACVIFGAPAWQCAARDQWIGWSIEQRAQRLSGVASNTRFLIFDWIGVPHLASHILGSIRQRIAADWKAKTGKPSWSWKHSWIGSVLPEAAIGPPIGFASARLVVAGAKVPMILRPRLRTSTFTLWILTSVNTSTTPIPHAELFHRFTRDKRFSPTRLGPRNHLLA